MALLPRHELPLAKINGLYLVQLPQIEDELERLFELNRKNEIWLADPQRLLESASAMLANHISQRALNFENSRSAVVAPSALSPLLRFWYARTRALILRKQILAIKLSGLFDAA